MHLKKINVIFVLQIRVNNVLDPAQIRVRLATVCVPARNRSYSDLTKMAVIPAKS